MVKKFVIGPVLLLILVLILVGGLAVEHYVAKGAAQTSAAWEGQIVDDNRYVFYPWYLPKNCEQTLAELDKGELRLDGGGPEMVGLNPEWDLGVGSSGYANFYLHSLRFVTCLIDAGARGDTVRLEQSAVILRSWLANNAASASSVSGWAWTEHATSWRAIVFSYFLLAARQQNQLAADDTLLFSAALNQHVNFIRRASVYRPDHNHGLNNALALLALAMVTDDALIRGELLQLGFSRAEQQMRDNVSSDGIHLEQSGFYQFYTIRSFLEILRVSRNIGWPISERYQDKLAKMIHAGDYMAGNDGRVDGLPYSKPQSDMTAIFNQNPDLIRGGHLLNARGEKIDDAKKTRLSVHGEGGYSFFAAEHKDDMEIVFHTRILDAPHAHRDALGISVRNREGVLVPFTSTMHVSENSARWKKYFLGSSSHNGVAVDGLEQVPLSRQRAGLLAKIMDSWKLNAIVESAGLADWFTEFRRRHQLDRRSLQERAVRSGGEILNSGSNGIVDYVTAKHTTYRGVEQVRMVARIGSRVLLVWDRVRGDRARQYVQKFHFMPDSRVDLNGAEATISRHGRVIGKARQFLPAETRICTGENKAKPCGWYTDTPSVPHATPVMMSVVNSTQAEFLWMLHIGDGDTGVVLQTSAGEEVRRLELDVNGKRYAVELSSRGVSVELARSL